MENRKETFLPQQWTNTNLLKSTEIILPTTKATKVRQWRTRRLIWTKLWQIHLQVKWSDHPDKDRIATQIMETVETCTIWLSPPAMCNSNPTWAVPPTFNKTSIKICTSTSRINYSIRVEKVLLELMLSKTVRQISPSKMINGINRILNRLKNHSRNKVK